MGLHIDIDRLAEDNRRKTVSNYQLELKLGSEKDGFFGELGREARSRD